MNNLKILHTSDWHLGHRFYDQSRYNEQKAFLDWLLTYLQSHHVDALLISGDIYHSASPSNQAQELYHQFLLKASQTSIRKIIITAGNHDSPAQLSITGDILKHFKVSVIPKVTELKHLFVDITNDQDEIIGRVLAVPFLREKDLLSYKEESVSENRSRLAGALGGFYSQLVEQSRKDLPADIPIIAMGHLYVSGTTTSESEREIHIGDRGNISVNVFPVEKLDYVALGHLHCPQRVSGSEKIRYSGSPIPMSFSEKDQIKQLLQLEWQEKQLTIQEIEIPQSVRLVSFSGTPAILKQKIQEFEVIASIQTYAETIVSLNEPQPEIFDQIKSWCDGRVKLMKVTVHYPQQELDDSSFEELENLSPLEIFQAVYQRQYGDLPSESMNLRFQTLVQELESADEDHRS